MPTRMVIPEGPCCCEGTEKAPCLGNYCCQAPELLVTEEAWKAEHAAVEKVAAEKG